jgi:hypothetical protein
LIFCECLAFLRLLGLCIAKFARLVDGVTNQEPTSILSFVSTHIIQRMFRVLFVFVALGVAADPLKVVDSYARYLSSGDCNAWANLFSPTGCKVDKPRKDALVCVKKKILNICLIAS